MGDVVTLKPAPLHSLLGYFLVPSGQLSWAVSVNLSPNLPRCAIEPMTIGPIGKHHSHIHMAPNIVKHSIVTVHWTQASIRATSIPWLPLQLSTV